MITQPIKWHGGKHYLAKRIVELMPSHTRYLEAFAGGLSVLMAKPCEGVAEWANDLNGKLMNFWRVIGSESMFEQFRRQVEALPLSEEVFEDAKRLDNEINWGRCGETSPTASVYRAVIFFVRMRQSRQGLGRDYCTPTRRTRRGMNEQVSAWLTAVDGLPEVHARLRRVEVLNRPAAEAIAKLDGEDLLVYADPPYLHETRSSTGEYGEHEMADVDHAALLAVLSTMRGRFLLSGYRCPLYDGAAAGYGWRRVDFDLPNNASSKKTKERKTECVWMNF